MSAQQFDGAGFAVGDVRGTRAWKVDTLGRLRGIIFEQIWRPGENMSECLRGVSPSVYAAGGGKASIAGPPSTVVRGGSGGGGGGSTTFFRGQAVTTFTSVGGQVISFNGPVAVQGNQATVCSCGCGAVIPGADVAMEPQPCSGIAPSCGCGFYGYQEGSCDYYTPGSGEQKGAVGGVFRGYGKVVLGTRGFRAEKAEILALYVDAEALLKSDNKIADSLIRMRLEENYKVPVFDQYLDLLKAFPPDPPERDDSFWEPK